MYDFCANAPDDLGLGYVAGETYHNSYWHYDWKCRGYDSNRFVVAEILTGPKAGEFVHHLTAKDHHTVKPGECPRQKNGYDCVNER
jgi:hypothetical protein